MNGPLVTVEVARRRPDAPVKVALLHGMGTSAALWEPLVRLLPDTMQAWTFGLPWDAGRGGGWALERDSRVWLEWALAAAPGAPDVIVAHSFAANVLLDRIVTMGPVGCRGLVLFAPFYRPSPDRFDWATLRHYVDDFGDLIRAGILARSGREPAPDLLDAMVAKVLERIGPYSWLRFFDLFTSTPFLDLDKVDVPCLVVGAEHDTASYPADCASLVAALPSARLEILPGCGHFGVAHEPAAAAALVGGFVEEMSAAVVSRGAAT